MLKDIIQKIRPTNKRPNKSYLMNSYARQEINFVRGEGSLLFDSHGQQYLDALGGLAVTILGHSHPEVSESISLQASKLIHASNLFQIFEQEQLAQKFCQISAMDKAFFGNSGAEANEAAIKLTRLYASKKKIADPIIITTEQSFHGRTLATLSASGNASIQAGLAPLTSKFIHVPFGDINELAKKLDNDQVVAVMLEPIQGESGVIVPPEGYLQQVRQLCDEANWLLIIDEIQTGMGRTGKWFAHQHENIKPDIITCAKGMANGLPIGVCAASGIAAELFTPGSHGSTFGGNPLSCQTALCVIDIIEREELMDNANIVGDYLKKQIQQRICTLEAVVDIRGKGMMLAIELDQAYPNLKQQFLAAKLIVNITGDGKVIRLLPAINLSESNAKKIAQIIHNIVLAL